MSDPVLEALNRAAEEVTPADIDKIIAYLRKARTGGKAPTKSGAEPVDLVEKLRAAGALAGPKIQGLRRI